MEQYLWLIPLGVLVGAFGTLIGAGGGFLLVPALLLLYPTESPEIITSISLAVVFFNAVSGSVAYARMGRIDYKSGLLLAAATIPGAIFGALSTDYIPRREFNIVFGVIILCASVFLLVYRAQESSGPERKNRWYLTRHLVEKSGSVHDYAYDSRIGLGSSLFVGYLSSLLGIGGGIIHVPVLVRLLRFPTHIATATSHFVLAIMALAGTIVHIVTGSFYSGIGQTAALAIGVLLGAQVGARLSDRVHGVWIIRSLAIALCFVGIRILIMSF
jgi:hypothetical protein